MTAPKLSDAALEAWKDTKEHPFIRDGVSALVDKPGNHWISVAIASFKELNGEPMEVTALASSTQARGKATITPAATAAAAGWQLETVERQQEEWEEEFIPALQPTPSRLQAAGRWRPLPFPQGHVQSMPGKPPWQALPHEVC